MAQQSTAGVTARNGLLFGAIIAALIIGGSIVFWRIGATDITGQSNGSSTIGSLTITSQGNGSPTTANMVTFAVAALMGFGIFLGSLALTFLAGLRTARRTGGVGAGAIAGLIAGAFGALVGGGVSLIFTIVLEAPTIHAPMGSGLTQSQMQGSFVSNDIVGSIMGLFQFGSFGAGLGALGGALGRNRYLRANPPQPYQGPFLPGGPGQPGAYYPAPPPYAPYAGPRYAPPPYAPPAPDTGPHDPMSPSPDQASYPAPPAQSQEPQPPQLE